ncbi:hypothetical protein AA313_de0205916 [Arthrobotrys entomopaga]|nr:hypothetical protein AA313_de0205916 [Arthrobotrys entomopaga]
MSETESSGPGTEDFQEIFLYGPEADTTWILDDRKLEEFNLKLIISLEDSFKYQNFETVCESSGTPSSASSEIDGLSKSLREKINDILKRKKTRVVPEKEWEISFYNWSKDLLKNLEVRFDTSGSAQELSGPKPVFIYSGDSSWRVYREGQRSNDFAKSVTIRQVQLRKDRLNPYIPRRLHRPRGQIPDISYGIQLDLDATWDLDHDFWQAKLPAANSYSALKDGVRERILFPYLLHELKKPGKSGNEAMDQLLLGMTQCLHGIVDATNPNLGDENSWPLRTVFGLATVGTRWDLYVLYLTTRQPKKAKHDTEFREVSGTASSTVEKAKPHKFFRRIAYGNLRPECEDDIRYFVWVMLELLKHIETELFPSVIKALKKAAGEEWFKVFNKYKPPNFKRPSVLSRSLKAASKQPATLNYKGVPINFKFSEIPEISKYTRNRNTRPQAVNINESSRPQQRSFPIPPPHVQEDIESSEDSESSEDYNKEADDSGYISGDGEVEDIIGPSLKNITTKYDHDQAPSRTNHVPRNKSEPRARENEQAKKSQNDEDLQALYQNFSEELWKELFMPRT